METSAPLLACVVLALSSACAKPNGDHEIPDAGPVVLAPCGVDERSAATIDVSERFDIFHTDIYSRVGALLRDATTVPLDEVVLEEGECRYLRLALGFCDPRCADGEMCTADDECQPTPQLISGGTLRVTGLGDPIEVEPESWSAGTYVGPGGLPADLFDQDDTVYASLRGDAFPALALGARGVAAIDTDLTGSGLELLDGQDSEITWTPGPDPDACVQLVLNGFNELHGAPLGDVIRCESADDGSLLVPQALVEAFPMGETPEVTEGYDWPHSELTRYTRSTREVEQGPVALWVRSTTYFRLSHP